MPFSPSRRRECALAHRRYLLRLFFNSAALTLSIRLLPAYGYYSHERRKGEKDFLVLWKNADADVPVLKEAKTEFARLR
jgi:hypothetical protein